MIHWLMSEQAGLVTLITFSLILICNAIQIRYFRDLVQHKEKIIDEFKEENGRLRERIISMVELSTERDKMYRPYMPLFPPEKDGVKPKPYSTFQPKDETRPEDV